MTGKVFAGASEVFEAGARTLESLPRLELVRLGIRRQPAGDDWAAREERDHLVQSRLDGSHPC